jgi:hypothetical protein
MKKFTIIFLMLAASWSYAQNAPINFEPGGHGADWSWTVFENGPNTPLEIITNPDQSGINTSAMVAKFTALQIGQPWAGVESAHGDDDLGPFVLDATNSIVKIMVWKPVISDVGIKLVAASGWAQPEIKVANTMVNQWEELTFDFSAYPNPPASEGQYDQIVIFPDFDLSGRTQDNVIYFDNITFNEAGTTPGEPNVAAPTPPLRDPDDVISIFSHAYVNVPETDFNPYWGQSTIVSFVEIQGNETMKYANFNYQGTQFAGSLNVTEMEFLHIDMWTADATSVNIFCISPGPVETPFALPITPGEWVSYDIPLSAFAGVNMAELIQFKFDGGDGSQTIYLDNIYFYVDGILPIEPTVAAPTPPVRDPDDVVSIFSHAYANVPGTDFNPDWGQSTIVSFVEIQGNETMKYANFNYQGTQFAGSLNVTEMEFLHIDMWTADATSVNIFCISPGPVETAFALPITPGLWVSHDIPLSVFSNVNMAELIQFKFDGGNGSQSIWLDNLYFYKPIETPKNPIDFEVGGYGADWTWTVFENNTNPPLEIIPNPDQTGINISVTVAKFTALQSGNPWAGCESSHGDNDLGPFMLDATNAIIKIMVWKPVISDVGIKLAAPTGWAQPEIKVANTLVNQWEELTFDFTGVPNPPASEGMYDQIIVFPDFDMAGRTQDNVIYFDNITFNSFLPGDSNCDGLVNVIDVVITANYILGANPDPFCFENADINGDGNVDVNDVIATVNIILSKK